MHSYYKEIYKDYTTAALLKITLQPDKYRMEAVAAANDLLTQRPVTIADRQHAAQELASVSAEKKEIIQSDNYIIDLLEPGLKTGNEVRVEKWLNFLVVVILLYFAWHAYDTVKSTIYFATTPFPFPWWTLASYLDVIATPLFACLLYRRKRLGWILLFGISLFGLVFKFYQLSTLSEFLFSSGHNTVSFFVALVIDIGTCIILWHKEVRERLYISDTLRTRVTLAALALILAYILIMRFLVPFLR